MHFGNFSILTITTNQYLDALRARKTHGPSTVFGSRRKAKGTEIDLDIAGGDDGAPDESATLQQRSRNELIVLKTKLQSCPTCGPDFFCKIGKDNKHNHLTHHQVQGWALALVSRLSSCVYCILIQLEVSRNAWSYL
jgi:hypothetical protein